MLYDGKMGDNPNDSATHEYHIEYFKMIQNVIERMARNSFLLKGWLVTILVAVVVLKLTDYNAYVSGVMLAASVMFWIMDSYYLQQERLFRMLWTAKVELFKPNFQDDVGLFDLDVKSFQNDPIIFKGRLGKSNSNKVSRIPRLMCSVSEFFFYVPLTAINIGLFIWGLFPH